MNALLASGAFLLTYRDRLWIYHAHGVSSTLWRTARRIAPEIQELLAEDLRAEESEEGFQRE